VAAVVCIVAGVARRAAAYYLGAATLMFWGLVWVYWTGTLEIGSWIAVSAERTIAGTVFVAGVGVAHLTARLVDQPEPDAAPGDAL
jgi:hypothetical protein